MSNEHSEDDVTLVSPFRIVNRGEDTVDETGRVVFADFSPRVVDSDTPDEVADELGKVPSVTDSVPSEDLPPKTEPSSSETSALALAASADLESKINESSTQPSSSDQKSG